MWPFLFLSTRSIGNSLFTPMQRFTALAPSRPPWSQRAPHAQRRRAARAAAHRGHGGHAHNKFQCFNHKAAFDGPPDWISHASLMLHSASFECSCWPAPLPPGGAPAPLLSLSADTRGRTCSPRGRRRIHPGVRPAKGQCRSRSVLTPLALDALGPFSPHPTAQVLRLA